MRYNAEFEIFLKHAKYVETRKISLMTRH